MSHSTRRVVEVDVGLDSVAVVHRVGGGGDHSIVGNAVLGPPSHEVRSGKSELGREPLLVSVLGSLGSGRGKPHAQLVHHARVEAVLRYKRHADVTPLKANVTFK